MNIDRRGFLSLSAAAGVGLACARRAAAAEFKTSIRKACIVDSPGTEAEWKKIKDQGFDGVETRSWNVAPDAAEKMRAMAEKAGLRIHSVMRAWTQVDDPAQMQADVDSVAVALKAAQAYGADAILWVPSKIGRMPMPEPWEFKIAFDEKSGHLKQVVDGDNEKYKAYIEAHDRATDATLEAVQKLIPVAEETKVIIGLENVWNNLWVKPDLYRWLVASFQSPWVKAYYDIGNHVKYAPPEEWIKALGPLIAKLHAKDFALNADGHGGKFVPLRKGSINWPAVRTCLDEVGYNGWMTVEGAGTLQDLILIDKGE